jgi:hypothetical protein
MDHAGPFGDAAQPHSAPADLHTAADQLRARISGHDRRSRGWPVVRAKRIHQARDGGQQPIHRQLHANHTGAHHKDGVIVCAERLCNRLLSSDAGVDVALYAGAGIGAAGVDDHRVNALWTEVQQHPIVDHRRGGKGVLREDRRSATRDGAGDQRQISIAVLLDAGGNAGNVEASNRVRRCLGSERRIEGLRLHRGLSDQIEFTFTSIALEVGCIVNFLILAVTTPLNAQHRFHLERQAKQLDKAFSVGLVVDIVLVEGDVILAVEA